MFKEKTLIYREGASEDLSKYPVLSGAPEKEDPDKKEIERVLSAMTEYTEIKGDYGRISSSTFSSEQIKEHSRKAEALVLNKMRQTPGMDSEVIASATSMFSDVSSVIGVDLQKEEPGRMVVAKTSGLIDIMDSATNTARALFESKQITKKEFVQVKAVCELFSYAINSITELLLTKGRQALMDDTSSDLFKAA